jgi:cell division protein FtsQ
MKDNYTKIRPLPWETEMPAETRVRRMEPGVPLADRVLPGMPLDLEATEDDDAPLHPGSAFDGNHPQRPRRRWWRPSGTAGRVFLGLGILVVLGGVGTSIFLLKAYLGRDSRFRIEGTGNIETAGLAEVSRTEMIPVFGEDIGRNIFFVPLSERRKQLEQIPWVEKATVMRLFPDRIRVQIVERQPVAFARQGQQFGLVDGNGVLLSMPPAAMAERHYSFPVVTGINAQDDAAVRKARMAAYLRLLSELDSNQQKISGQLSEIDLSNPDDLRVLMPEQGTDILAHFGSDHFQERYQRYRDHIAEWRQQYPRLAAVDLRYDSQVVLEMQSGVGSDSDSTKAKTAADAATPANSEEKTTASNQPVAPAANSHTNSHPGTAMAATARSHAGAPSKNPAKTISSNKNKSSQASGKLVRKAALKSKPASKPANQAARPSVTPSKASGTAHNAVAHNTTPKTTQQNSAAIARTATVKVEAE